MNKKTERRILKTAVFFAAAEDDDTGPCFAHQAILYTDGHNLYLAEGDSELEENEINVDSLAGKVVLPETVYPPYDASKMTKVLSSKGCYVKFPDILSHTLFGEHSSHLKELLLEETLVCEELLRKPHPNIQKYYGCQTVDGLITSLCFKRYVENLRERVEGRKETVNVEQVMEGIRSAVHHIHNLGYCHNDIHPGNIMFDEHDVATLIDFDSCKKIGRELGIKAGNRDFFPHGEVLSVQRNDFYALEKLEEYLNENCRSDKDIAEKAPKRENLYKS